LSRCRVLVTKPIGGADLAALAARALADAERGLGGRGLALDDVALRVLVQAAAGDARRLLTSLEVAADMAEAASEKTIARAHVEQAISRRVLLYDNGGEEHYNVVSAFIKSLRGSDPDAALHYMVRMLEAGEDPIFVLRRMVIFASEDVGSADPMALVVAVNALAAFELVGMPEGSLPMTQAAQIPARPRGQHRAGRAVPARRALRPALLRAEGRGARGRDPRAARGVARQALTRARLHGGAGRTWVLTAADRWA
jgi:putative ATPase